jgi:hypothetical protein
MSSRVVIGSQCLDLDVDFVTGELRSSLPCRLWAYVMIRVLESPRRDVPVAKTVSFSSNKFGIDLPNDNGEDHDYGSGLPHHRQVEQKRSTDKNFIAQPFPRGDSFLVCL